MDGKLIIPNLCLVALFAIVSIACSSSKGDLVPMKAFPDVDFTQAHELHILSYNVYMRSPRLFFWNQQQRRTKLLPPFLRGYDVVLLQEIFGSKIREEILDSLKLDYPYHSKLLGKDRIVQQDGGVLVLSRWPIEVEKSHIYTECAGADCLAEKGVIYLKLLKQGKPYHIFASHTQASKEHRATRAQQFREMAAMIQEQAIPKSEPVIIGGDLNVDMLGESSLEEYQDMLQILKAIHPQDISGQAYPPSYDAKNNSLVGGEEYAYLDYVLYGKEYLLPDSAYNEVRIFKMGDLDLSDHYAVYGYFSF